MTKIPRHGKAEQEPRFTIAISEGGTSTARTAKHPGEDLALMEALNEVLHPKDRPPCLVKVMDEDIDLFTVEKDEDGIVHVWTR